LARVIAHCRRIGTAKMGIQIAHAGRKASARRPWEGGQSLPAGEDPWPTIGPSPIPFGAAWPAPREMTNEDIARLRDAFRSAAIRAVRVGFDAIELHMAHGYLIHSFLSPISNKRTDGYGGPFEGRMRFPLEIATVVREVVPARIAVGARITGTDWMDGGLTPEDAVAFAKALKQLGLDYVDISSGGVTAETKLPVTPGFNAPVAEKVRREAGVATRVVGLIATSVQAEAIIAEGKADMVALARGFLDNPHWGWHAAQELEADVKRPQQYARAAPGIWPAATYRLQRQS
jgi:NADPH2 dehydrogenase